ncbi:hypothetical protein JCM8547_000458 [Rhodosporidiobolus lusitaniae]
MARSSSSSVKIQCSICYDGQPPEDATEKGWVAITSCGHMVHEYCLKRWDDSKQKIELCPFGCTDRDVTCRPDRRDGLVTKHRMSLPLLRLFLPEPGAGAPSSDAIAASQLQFFARSEGPVRASSRTLELEDDEIEDEEDDAEGESEVERLRRELRVTRQNTRDQHVELESLRARLANSEPDLAALDTQEAEISRVEELEIEIAELQALLGRAEKEKEEAEKAAREATTKAGLLEGDLHEARIKWREERTRLQKQLSIADTSGEVEIKRLEERIKAEENKVMHAAGRVDFANEECKIAEKEAERIKRLLDDERKRHQQDTKRHQQDTKVERERLQQLVEAAQARAKQLEGANREYQLKNKKLKDKLAKKGTIFDDEDVEPDNLPPAPAPPAARPFAPRTFGRTASSRSRASPSPAMFDGDDDSTSLPAFKVNNNSRLLASPTKRKRERSVMDDDAYDVSDRSAELKQLSGRRPRLVENEEQDVDSDLEVLEPTFPVNKGKGKASSTSSATLQPLSSRPSLTNSLLPPFSSSLQPLVSSSSTSSSGTKRPALSQSKADKYLPSFQQGTLEFGQKKKPKVTRK